MGRTIPTQFKPHVVYLQEGQVSYTPIRVGMALRAVTVLTPHDLSLDGDIYTSNADIASFFVSVGERVIIDRCDKCDGPVDRNEIHHPPGLTLVHRCAYNGTDSKGTAPTPTVQGGQP